MVLRRGTSTATVSYSRRSFTEHSHSSWMKCLQKVIQGCGMWLCHLADIPSSHTGKCELFNPVLVWFLGWIIHPNARCTALAHRGIHKWTSVFGYRIPRRKGRQLLRGLPTYQLAGCSHKLHEEIKKFFWLQYLRAPSLDQPLHMPLVNTGKWRRIGMLHRSWLCRHLKRISVRTSVFCLSGLFFRQIVYNHRDSRHC